MLPTPASLENDIMIIISLYKQTYYLIKAYSRLQTSGKLAILDNAEISLSLDGLANTSMRLYYI